MQYNTTNMEKYINSLLNFMDDSVCNFCAVVKIKNMLNEAGFQEINLADAWTLKKGGKYYTTKNDTAVFSFVLGEKSPVETGFRIIAAHSDSPCFRIKPNAEMKCEKGIVKLNTEVYGGPILYTWFDRPLSVAGRVVLKGDDALHPVTRIVKIDRPILLIPHLAIHFNRAVNEGNHLSKQKDMLPVIGIFNEEAEKDNILLNTIAQELGVSMEDILDFDLLVYDVQKANLVGMHDEFVSSGRLDDLSMAHAALMAIIEGTDTKSTHIMAIFDNEETGSGTKQGAASPVLKHILERINNSYDGKNEDFHRALAKSFMVSADNAHAFHPNYTEKYDPTNHPAIGGGPVIKINANCKYMSDAHSAAVFRSLCEAAGSPYQYFVNHSDVAGGSTLGNILTSQIDIEGVDVGNALWAMHSARETASVADHCNMIKVMKYFFSC